MSKGDAYRAKAAQLRTTAKREDPLTRAELEWLADGYLKLAEQAERNSRTDIVYETPPAQNQQQAQQQQQIQSKSKLGK